MMTTASQSPSPQDPLCCYSSVVRSHLCRTHSRSLSSGADTISLLIGASATCGRQVFKSGWQRECLATASNMVLWKNSSSTGSDSRRYEAFSAHRQVGKKASMVWLLPWQYSDCAEDRTTGRASSLIVRSPHNPASCISSHSQLQPSLKAPHCLRGKLALAGTVTQAYPRSELLVVNADVYQRALQDLMPSTAAQLHTQQILQLQLCEDLRQELWR